MSPIPFMSDLNALLDFVRMSNQLRQVKRMILAPGEDRWENDLEHHYQLTLVAWYLAQSQNWGLDVDKVLRYALVHDIVEVYAGDVDTFAKDKSMKQENERLAAERLKKEFPAFSEMHAFIEAYEAKADKESRFVYALDKILPTFNNYLDNGATWKKRNITLEMVQEVKKGKISQFPEIEKLFAEFVPLLVAKEKELFPPKK